MYRSPSGGQLMFVGFVLTFIGTVSTGFSTVMLLQGKSAQGRFVRYETRLKNGRTTNTHSIYSFVTKGGQSGQVQSKVGIHLGSKPPATVKVLYNANNPSNCRVNSPLDLWFYPILMLGGGVTLLAIGGTRVHS